MFIDLCQNISSKKTIFNFLKLKNLFTNLIYDIYKKFSTYLYLIIFIVIYYYMIKLSFCNDIYQRKNFFI
jgi:hypothetical protein